MGLIWTRREFDAAYSRYGREYALSTSQYAQRASWLLSNVPQCKHGPALVAGCGFGYLVHELRQRGIDAIGCDASAYIRQNLCDQALSEFPFLSVDVQTLAQRHYHSQRYTAVITEFMLESFDPIHALDEYRRLLGDLTALALDGQVLHFVIDHRAGDSHVNLDVLPLTWLTLREWRASWPLHRWVSGRDLKETD